MTRRVHRLFLPLTFPCGIAPGEGGDYNLLIVARSGVDEDASPVLRGTALAGALRHAWRSRRLAMGARPAEITEDERHFFGYALERETESGAESRLQVGDCKLDLGGQSPSIRTHHFRNRHTGAVADGGLFSLEACPPGTSTHSTLWLMDDKETADPALDFLNLLTSILDSGLTLGGQSARGIGVLELDRGGIVYRCYDLTDIEDYAAYVDDHRAWRKDPSVQLASPQSFSPPAGQAGSTLTVQFTLGIPRGQDILIGDGQGLDHEIEQQRVRAVDGKLYWRIPGASLRGLFRGWVGRLAAREGLAVADIATRQVRSWSGEDLPKSEQISGDNVGWCFLPEERRKPGIAQTDCPVARLFGSLFQAGRVFIGDSLAECSSPEIPPPTEEQTRMHVALDLVTGGAIESMLFDNTVLTAYSEGASPLFKVSMRVDNPSPDEARWLVQTLRALDLGILRVGSSKSAGRLSLMDTPTAQGPEAHQFSALKPWFGPEMFSTKGPLGSDPTLRDDFGKAP